MITPGIVVASREPRKQDHATRSESPARSTANPAARVVIIEDDDEIREALAELLQSIGYSVVTYDRADRALAELEHTASPDLILLDLMMPGMNGWQFRIEQKKHHALREVPVVVLSADVSPYAGAIDADAYMAKPIDFDELAAVVSRVLAADEPRRMAVLSSEDENIRSLRFLVATAAHEINNQLSCLLGCVQLALEQERERAQTSHASMSGTLTAMIDSTQRVAAMVKLLAAFSRADESGPIDVMRAVRAAARMAEPQIALHAQFRVELAAVPALIGNEARLTQAILNLLINAAHAIRRIQRANEVSLVMRHVPGVVVIEVSDTGAGIAPEVLHRVFEPYFTTKPTALGTGLGLTIARETIVQMGGTVTAQSIVGQGTTFRVMLPCQARQHVDA
jgi:signal transduction histidine kinase